MVRLIPAQFVKPYVKSNKSDIIDAEAIAEAVTRPTMRFAAMKSEEQADLQALHPSITDDVFSVLSVQNSVKSRKSFGGTAPQEVRRQIRYWRKRLAKA